MRTLYYLGRKTLKLENNYLIRHKYGQGNSPFYFTSLKVVRYEIDFHLLFLGLTLVVFMALKMTEHLVSVLESTSRTFCSQPSR